MKRMLSDVWDGLRFQPGRTALSILALCVGMTALTVLLAVLGGLREKSKAIIKEIGANVFLILPADGGSLNSSMLTLSSSAIIQKSIPDSKIGAIRLFSFNTQSPRLNLRVFAADNNYFQMQNRTLLRGRMPDQHDHDTANRVALITSTLADSTGWQINSTIHINNIPFVIAGILDRPAISLAEDSPDIVYAPDQSTVLVPLACSGPWMKDQDIKRRRLDMIAVQVQEPSKLESIVKATKRILSTAAERGEYAWITPDSLLHNIRSLQRTVALTAGSVALLCLVLGGTTLMSLMTANVRDRIGEIALRRTLGATARDIAVLFITEACIVTLTASLTGITIAVILTKTAHTFVNLPAAISPVTLILPLGVSILLGALFSYLPVRLATAITPAEALRND